MNCNSKTSISPCKALPLYFFWVHLALSSHEVALFLYSICTGSGWEISGRWRPPLQVVVLLGAMSVLCKLPWHGPSNVQGYKSHRRADGKEVRTWKSIISACSTVNTFEWKFTLPATHKQEVVAEGRDGKFKPESWAPLAPPALWGQIVWWRQPQHLRRHTVLDVLEGYQQTNECVHSTIHQPRHMLMTMGVLESVRSISGPSPHWLLCGIWQHYTWWVLSLSWGNCICFYNWGQTQIKILVGFCSHIIVPQTFQIYKQPSLYGRFQRRRMNDKREDWFGWGDWFGSRDFQFQLTNNDIAWNTSRGKGGTIVSLERLWKECLCVTHLRSTGEL